MLDPANDEGGYEFHATRVFTHSELKIVLVSKGWELTDTSIKELTKSTLIISSNVIIMFIINDKSACLR